MGTVTRYVIGPDVALRLARDEAVIPDEHQILAPTLLRSQLLSRLYQAVRSGEMTKKDAERLLNHVRGLRIRLLGDRVLLVVPPADGYGASGQPSAGISGTDTLVFAVDVLGTYR